MVLELAIRNIQDIMRQDEGIDGDAQRIAQLVWILFLKVYDAKELEWQEKEEDFQSIIPEELRWRNWAAKKQEIEDQDLIDFVNKKLFPSLKNLEIREDSPKRASMVKAVFEDSFNYMKNGNLLKKVIAILNKVDFTTFEERHAFNEIYERILKDLKNAGNSGEYYTPRVFTDFIMEALDPEIGERIGDLSCGTGGFLVSALDYLHKKARTPAERKIIHESLYGIEKKPMPHILCVTNLLLHDVDSPKVFRGNSLSDSVQNLTQEEKFEIIAMNPPFGGTESKEVLKNFPRKYRISETADLFMVVIMRRLNENARAGIVLPDGFLFASDGVKLEIKKELLDIFNLHTIIRVPEGVFAPYTPISTNILFFSKNGPTEKIDYFQVPLPKGYKNGFTKTRPIQARHMQEALEWFKNKKENENAFSVSREEIIGRNYNLDIRKDFSSSFERESSISDLMMDLDLRIERFKNLYTLLEEELRGVEDR